MGILGLDHSNMQHLYDTGCLVPQAGIYPQNFVYFYQFTWSQLYIYVCVCIHKVQASHDFIIQLSPWLTYKTNETQVPWDDTLNPYLCVKNTSSIMFANQYMCACAGMVILQNEIFPYGKEPITISV